MAKDIGKSGYFGLSNFLSHMLPVDSDPGIPGLARTMSGLLTKWPKRLSKYNFNFFTLFLVGG